MSQPNHVQMCKYFSTVCTKAETKNDSMCLCTVYVLECESLTRNKKKRVLCTKQRT